MSFSSYVARPVLIWVVLLTVHFMYLHRNLSLMSRVLFKTWF